MFKIPPRKSYQIHVPCLPKVVTMHPKISKLDAFEQYCCVKVLAARNAQILPQMYLPQPTQGDLELFESLKAKYEIEMQSFIEWAKKLWRKIHFLKAICIKPYLDKVYEARFKMRAAEMSSYPKLYVYLGRLPLDMTDVTCNMELFPLSNARIASLPLIEYPELNTKFTIIKNHKVPKPCKRHPYKFSLPNGVRVGNMPLIEIQETLAQYGFDNDVQIVASENALKCLLESDRSWNLSVGVFPFHGPGGEKKNVMVLGSEFSTESEDIFLRVYQAFRLMLRHSMVPPTEISKMQYTEELDQWQDERHRFINFEDDQFFGGECSSDVFRFTKTNEHGDLPKKRRTSDTSSSDSTERLLRFAAERVADVEHFRTLTKEEAEAVYAETVSQDKKSKDQDVASSSNKEIINLDSDSQEATGSQAADDAKNEDKEKSEPTRPGERMLPLAALYAEESKNSDLFDVDDDDDDDNSDLENEDPEKMLNRIYDQDSSQDDDDNNPASNQLMDDDTTDSDTTEPSESGERQHYDLLTKEDRKRLKIARCSCRGTIFEKPSRRSYQICQITNQKGNKLKVIVHCSHKVRDQEGEVLLEPIPEYQLELGGCAQSHQKIRSLALSLFLRQNATLLNVRTDVESGEVASFERMTKTEFMNAHTNIQNEISNILHSTLSRLSGLDIGFYILQHDQSHGNDAVLHAAGVMIDATFELNFDSSQQAVINRVDILSKAPTLVPVFLPAHKYQRLLPCAFTPYIEQLELSARKKLRRRPPPMLRKYFALIRKRKALPKKKLVAKRKAAATEQNDPPK